MEVAPGVHQLRLPLLSPGAVNRAGITVNIYLLKGRDGFMLIDSGWNTEDCRNTLQQQLSEIGVSFADIGQVIYTHAHPDHAGLAGMFKEQGARQAAHRIEIQYIRHLLALADKGLWDEEGVWLHRQGVPFDQMAELQQMALDMGHRAWRAVPEKALEDGDTIDFSPFQFKVVWSPGNTLGHVSFLETRLKMLFCGDHLTGAALPHIPFDSSYGEDDDPLGLYINSLRSLKEVDAELILPGHGRVFRGLQPRLLQIIAEMERAQVKTLGIMGGQEMTAFEVAVRSDPRADWKDVSSTEKRGRLRVAVARLQGLKCDGRVERVPRDGVIYYRRAAHAADNAR